MRLAMWSGPRNISTAMMYAFAQRTDFCAIDEPFYAAYLARTGLAHPMRDEVLASQPKDPAQVVVDLATSATGSAAHQYEKHMTQHMLQGTSLAWLGEAKNVFLIRHPARVVASFADRYENPTLADIGFAAQAQIYRRVCAFDAEPVVIDSTDIRADPERTLRLLCDVLDLPWDPAMLSWPAGGCSADGVWASHWYAAVHRSTGFAGAEGSLPELSDALAALAEEAQPYYEELYANRVC
ncbi:MAG: HAD family hydrolase [Pseudomonadota bacterium]